MQSDLFQIPVSLLQKISSDQAYHYRIIPFKMQAGTLLLKTDQISTTLQQELEIVLNTSVLLIEEKTGIIQQLLSKNYRKSNIEHQDLHFSDNFLQKLLLTAKDIGSSDIHFEPYEEFCRVRFRLDGKLKEYYTISLEEYPTIANQLKIQGGLDISEKRLPQDGRITVKYMKIEFDIRVSSLPTLHGEKIVLR